MWHRRYGKWWMVQWGRDIFFSLGVHLEPRYRLRGDGINHYGPYVDLHLIFAIISLGWQPVYAGEIQLRSSAAIAREQG